MADKLNMSLEDIIKQNKKQVKKEITAPSNSGNQGRGGNKKPAVGNRKAGAGRRAPPAKNARVALANKVLKRSKAIVRRAGVGAQKRVVEGRPAAGTALNAVATKKLVNKLVKNALRKRTNITTAQVIRKRGGVAASTLATRRNLAVRRNIAAARSTLQPVRTVIQAPRSVARQPVQYVQEVRPTRVVRQVITAPPVEVIRRAPPQQARRRPQQQRVIVQQVAQPQAGRRFRQKNIVQRHNQVFTDRPTVVRRQPVQQQRRVQYQQVVQRVVQSAPQQRPRQFQRAQPNGGGNVRYVNKRPAQQQQQRRTVVQQVRPVTYRPVQYVTEQVVSSRGRGFRGF